MGRPALFDLNRRVRGRRKGQKFKPFSAPTQPPPGWYDPTLDAQQRAAGRGLQDFTQDTARGQERADTDYTLGQQSIARNSGRSLSDILLQRRRTIQDQGIAQAGINRSYQQLGDAQRQSGASAGLLGGGFLAAAAKKRAANKSIEDQALALQGSRAAADSAQAQGRLGEDRTLASAQLGLGYSRGNQDRTTGLARAQRENTFFGQDVGAQRAYEAAQAGYIPPTRPRGEFSRGGVTWREQHGGGNLLPGGRVVSDRALLRMIQQRKRRRGGR